MDKLTDYANGPVVLTREELLEIAPDAVGESDGHWEFTTFWAIPSPDNDSPSLFVGDLGWDICGSYGPVFPWDGQSETEDEFWVFLSVDGDPEGGEWDSPSRW